MLKNKLQILLITYNRVLKLRNTFEQIFSENSPIKDFDITILDNASYDGTDELIKEYQKKYSNIEHIKNAINIGGNANICRAIEMAYIKNKEYFWILCDDDDYNFSAWNEVEAAVRENVNAILVEHRNEVSKINDYNLTHEFLFTPAAIYKTSLITSTILQNAYMNIYHCFPHAALICSLINNGYSTQDIRIVSKNIIMQGLQSESAFVRGLEQNELLEKQKHINLLVSYVNIYKNYTNKKFRKKCSNYLYVGKSFFYSAYKVWQQNKQYMPNLIDFFLGLSKTQRIQFILAILFGSLYYKLKNIIKILYLCFKTDILK